MYIGKLKAIEIRLRSLMIYIARGQIQPLELSPRLRGYLVYDLDLKCFPNAWESDTRVYLELTNLDGTKQFVSLTRKNWKRILRSIQGWQCNES